METLTKLTRAAELAAQILNISRNTLVVNMRYLDAALFRLKPQPAALPLATDGEKLYYDPFCILNGYKAEKNSVTRDLLHVLLHCIFRHPFVEPAAVDHNLWDLACDIAVENIINSFSISCAKANRQANQTATLTTLSQKLRSMTAEKIYRYLFDHPKTRFDRRLFFADDHALWYMDNNAEDGGNSDGDSDNNEQNGGPNSQSGDSDNNDQSREPNSQSGDSDNNDRNGEFDPQSGSSKRQSLSEEWKDVSERIQTDMETMSRDQGTMSGGMQQQLQELNREKYDYRAFLKKFAVMGEAMKINDDEFDYIFYTYGLKLFKNMPLIEPLEYKEVKRIRDFVIAIDTSGSTSGELVQKFLQKTFNILKSEETFFAKINLYIIQCDAEIQEVKRITSQEEFDEYIRKFTIKGLGGTDFRPVFEYVDRLVAEKAFTNLKGLIYFTDGCGTFPSKKPDYQTAFVFVQQIWNDLDVPPWAIKLILEPEEL